ALGGGLLALVVGQVASRLLVHQLATSVSAVTLDLTPDWRILAFTAAVSFGTALVFGLAPTAGLSGVSPNQALKERSRSVTGDRRFGIRNALVVAQVALSLVLVMGAGLFLKTFASLNSAPLGFDPTHLLVTTVDMRQSAATPETRRVLYDRVREAMAGVPGVRHVAVSEIIPVSGSGWNGRAKIEGVPELAGRAAEYWINPVSTGWFETYGIHVLSGRDVADSDTASSEPVVVVNETFVKRFIGGENAIGRMLYTDPEANVSERARIVGVVSDSVYRNARAGVYATAYRPFLQGSPDGAISASVKVTAQLGIDSLAARSALTEALSQVDSRLSFSFRDLSDQVRVSTSQERLVAMLSGFFGVLALLLAGMGLYGVTSYAVDQRRSEIAVRMALGATGTTVVRMVLARASALVMIGVLIGIGLSMWASKFVGKLLFGLTPRDPATMTMAIVALVVIGAVAAWLPARRASRLDPTAVLRE
ncbi:MAG: FtsX-like permease family protein, partial [Vicinamibacterales bacterium]